MKTGETNDNRASSTARSVRVPKEDDLAIRRASALTGKPYAYFLVEGARRLVAETEAEADLLGEMQAVLAGAPGAELAFAVSSDGEAEVALTPDQGTTLEQVAGVRLRPATGDRRVLELHGLGPAANTTIFIAELAAGMATAITVKLDDLLLAGTGGDVR